MIQAPRFEVVPELETRFFEVLAELTADGADGEQIAELLIGLGYETLTTVDELLPFELLAEASSEQVAFESSYRDVMRRVVSNDEAMLRELRKSILDYKRDVLDLIGDGGSDFAKHRLAQMQAAIDAAATRLEGRITGTWNNYANDNAKLAVMAVDNPLAKIGLKVQTVPVMLPTDQLAVMFNNFPTLIRGVAMDAAKSVGQTLTAQVLGGISAAQARQKIAGIVGPLASQANRLEVPGKVFDAAENRARSIMRTEMNRVYSTVSTARIDDLAARIPGVGKVWMHSPSSSHDPREDHAALNGKVIFPAKGEKFSVGGFLVDGPYDPALPAKETINCHCRTRVAYDAEVQAASGKEAPATAGGKPKTAKPKAPPKPKPKPAPAGKPVFRECKTVREAEKLATELINFGGNQDRFPIRPFTQDRLTIYKGRKAKMAGKASFGKKVSVDAANEINRALFEIAEDCERRGIPMIRGVVSHAPGAAADMGDAILGFSADSFNRVVAVAAKKPAITRSIETGERLDWFLSKMEERIVDAAETWKKSGFTIAGTDAAAGTVSAEEALAIVREARAELASKIGRLKAGELVEIGMSEEASTNAAGQYLWRGGRPLRMVGTASDGEVFEVKIASYEKQSLYSTGPVPSFSHSYVDDAQSLRSTMWHEYGHHVHQITQGSAAENASISPLAYQQRITERKFRQAYIAHFSNAEQVARESATVYGRTNPNEFFAECFATYYTDDRRRVPQFWIDFMKAEGLL